MGSLSRRKQLILKSREPITCLLFSDSKETILKPRKQGIQFPKIHTGTLLSLQFVFLWYKYDFNWELQSPMLWFFILSNSGLSRRLKVLLTCVSYWDKKKKPWSLCHFFNGKGHCINRKFIIKKFMWLLGDYKNSTPNSININGILI